ncbi:transcription antitermination factor NusB [Mycoplasmopsis ciconiae]|uniref:Transcription antitermination factor NusB n=1 Tax=Mycoplasmopsis ciconiae TaxID=561067 RepID=A0ABU7MLX3_9BACT|nr:transcription antitermination factor NusB [Mycoplasmopsis ciconiae]
MNKSRRHNRVEVIQVLYKYMLLNETIDAIEAFHEFDFLEAEQVQTIDKIAKNFESYKKVIMSFNRQERSWERIDPIIRAILLNAANELITIPPKIVINEALEITKLFFKNDPECDKLKNFVNALLQNIYKFIVFKASQKKENNNQ